MEEGKVLVDREFELSRKKLEKFRRRLVKAYLMVGLEVSAVDKNEAQDTYDHAQTYVGRDAALIPIIYHLARLSLSGQLPQEHYEVLLDGDMMVSAIA